MSSYCLGDKREKSTRGMAQGCQNRVTLAPRPTVPRSCARRGPGRGDGLCPGRGLKRGVLGQSGCVSPTDPPGGASLHDEGRTARQSTDNDHRTQPSGYPVRRDIRFGAACGITSSQWLDGTEWSVMALAVRRCLTGMQAFLEQLPLSACSANWSTRSSAIPSQHAVIAAGAGLLPAWLLRQDRRSRVTKSHSSVDRRTVSRSTRSLSPWNMATIWSKPIRSLKSW